MCEGEKKNNKKQIKQTKKPWVLKCSQLLVSVVGQGKDTMPPPDQKKKKVEDRTVKLNVRSSKDYIYCFLVCGIQGFTFFRALNGSHVH